MNYTDQHTAYFEAHEACKAIKDIDAQIEAFEAGVIGKIDFQKKLMHDRTVYESIRANAHAYLRQTP